MKKILLVEIFFSWGYMVKPPYLSGGGQSLPYPPPSTLIGALAAPYLRLREPREIIYIDNRPYSPTVEILDKVSYAVLGYPMSNVTEIIDINKYYSYAYLRQQYKKDEKFWSSAIGVGKIYSPTKAVIAYIVDNKHAEEITKAAWGITRIGSKEGLVAVTKTELIEKPEIIEEKRVIRTIFPTPSHIIEPRENCRRVYYWKVAREAYTSYMPKEYSKYLIEYIAPESSGKIYGGAMRVKPLDNAAVIKTPYSPLIVPKDIIGL